MEQKKLQKIIMIVSVVSFFGSTAYGTVSMFQTALNPSKQQSPQNQQQAIDKQLEAQERGYELVLKREPNNQVALEGIVQARVKRNDLKAAVEPMEKLVKLNPNRPDYKALLEQLKQRIATDKKN